MVKEITEKDLLLVHSLLEKVLFIKEYKMISRLGGLTNHTYKITLENGKEYVVRIPGEGTEEMINREDERVSTQLACSLEIDTDLLYFGKEGIKISDYIPNAITMSPESMRLEKRIKEAALIFKKLHACGRDTGVPFKIFEIAANYEKILVDNEVSLYEDYQTIKEKVMQLKENLDNVQKVSLVPCHNDPLCENWVEGNGRLYLIDWEYAGMNDGMWDLADISIEAGYDTAQNELLLKTYLDREITVYDRRHFLANKIYLDYLWTLWGKTRVPFEGISMELYATERYKRLKENLLKYDEIKGR